MKNLIGQRVESIPSPMMAAINKGKEAQPKPAYDGSVRGDKFVGWTCTVIAVCGLAYGLYTHSFVWPF